MQYDLYKHAISLLFCLVLTIAVLFGEIATSLNNRSYKNRAARVITGSTYDVRSSEILNKLGWKTLHERRQDQMASYVSKALTGKCPENISHMFEMSKNLRYN